MDLFSTDNKGNCDNFTLFNGGLRQIMSLDPRSKKLFKKVL